MNPHTKKMVKRVSQMGKKLVEAEKTGEEVAKMMTETQRLILVVQTLRDLADLDDSVIKAALKTIENELPRSFPSYWGGKQKEARHADHPKGPSNGYIFFTTAVRAEVKTANPGLSPKEIISLLAKQWNETEEKDRAEYEKLAVADKARYDAEMMVFEKEHPEEARGSKFSSPGKPTKTTAYHLFCEANRQMVKNENPEFDGKKTMQFLAEKWAELKKDYPEQAQSFQDDADEANVGFEDRVKEFHLSPGSPKKLSKVEQAKADDPEHYELNTETGRHMLKDGWKKNPNGTFVKKDLVKKDVAKPVAKKQVAKKVERQAKKEAVKKIEKITKQENEENEENEDEELLA